MPLLCLKRLSPPACRRRRRQSKPSRGHSSWKTVPCGKRLYFDVVCHAEPKQFNPLMRPACCVSLPSAGNTVIPNGIVSPFLTFDSVMVYKAQPRLTRRAAGGDLQQNALQPSRLRKLNEGKAAAACAA